MKSFILLSLPFLSVVWSLDPKSSMSQESPVRHRHQHLQNLFPSHPDFCDTYQDIRIVLLGQAWIHFGDTDLSDPDVKNMIDFLHDLDATVLFSNLETAINGSYAIKNGAPIFNPINSHVSPPAVIDILQKNYSSNVLSTANNHNSDIGPNGTISGILELKARNEKFTGSGYNAEEAIQPTYITTKKHLVVGVMGVVSSPLLSTYGGIANATTAGVNAMQLIGPNNTYPDPVARANNLAEANEACKKADLVVQYHHNHFANDTWAIDEWWQTFAHDTIDNGASVYLSQGGQNIRGIEIYKGSLLIYSNGNLFFQTDRNETQMNKEGYIVDLCYDGRSTVLKHARFVPTILTNGTNYQNKGVPTISTTDQALSTLRNLQNLSADLGTTIEIDEDNYVGYIDLSDNVITPPPLALKCKRNKDFKDHAMNDEWYNEDNQNWGPGPSNKGKSVGKGKDPGKGKGKGKRRR